MMRRLALLVAVAVICVPSSAFASNDPHFPRQWGMVKVGAESGWNRATGAGIVIAIVDTGVDQQHEEFAGRIVPGYDFVDNDQDPQDEDGHGTHVAGIAAAATNNGKGVAGVAPSAKIMPVRVLNEIGVNLSLNPQQLMVNTANGIRWAVDHGADVVNFSLGGVAGEGPGEAISSEIKRAWSKGVICVVAAGNDKGASGYRDEPALVVAATDQSDRLASYSNRSGDASWGIAAPGGDGSGSGRIYSTYYDYLGSPSSHDRYAYNSGTSMSAPHVAGAAAILRSMGISNEETVDRILTTAVDLGAPGVDPVFGRGRLNIAAAVSTAPPGGPGGTSPRPRSRGQRQPAPPASQAPPPGPEQAPPASPEASPTPSLPPPQGAGRPGDDDRGGSLTGVFAALVLLGGAGTGLAYVFKRRSTG